MLNLNLEIMAKVKHNHFLDTVDHVFSYAKKLKILHLKMQGKTFDGRTIQIGGSKAFHFGTTGYLGLEQDKRLKEAAKQAIDDFGTQFPLSKSYIAHPLYEELEKLLHTLYNQPVVVTKNATLAHMAAIPVVVGDNDAIVLDHQVHWSVQDAAKRLQLRGVKIELLRHNRLDLLEAKIQELGAKVDKIWYMADGVYSMYGDFAPVKDLLKLAQKYKQLHLYFDDVHGMSWFGKHGRGYVYEQLQQLPAQVVLIGTLSKTFGANGSFIICGDKLMQQKIKTFGGSLTFSAQLDPASVGAAIAAAKIHLSDEINILQEELQDRINYFNKLLAAYKIPLVETNSSPVFFIATGIPETGYQLTQQLLARGFYVNMGLFPAVPSIKTGLRITISRHNQKTEIRQLVENLASLYPKVMRATGNSLKRLNKYFKKEFSFPEQALKSTNYTLVQQNSITQIDKHVWNKHFKGKGILDWEGFKFIEDCFKTHKADEHKWKFFYIQIFDANNKLMLMAALTISLWKDDVLAKPAVSKAFEHKRKDDKYKFTSYVLSLGSLFSDGLPLYIHDKVLTDKTLQNLFFTSLENIAFTHKASQIVLRDFDFSVKYDKLFQAQGFITLNMPEVCLIENLNWNTLEGFLVRLSKRSQKHFKRDILPFRELVEVEVHSEVSPSVLTHYYALYKNVKNKNLGLNTFTYPISVFQEMNKSKAWEFISIKIKGKAMSKAIGVMFCYRNLGVTYVPSLVGINYNYNKDYQTYRQLLYESILQANNAGFKTVDFGISANFEKKKLGAEIKAKMAYVQSSSNFKMDYLESKQ